MKKQALLLFRTIDALVLPPHVEAKRESKDDDDDGNKHDNNDNKSEEKPDAVERSPSLAPNIALPAKLARKLLDVLAATAHTVDNPLSRMFLLFFTL
jgi:hypothetical protein